MTIKRKNNNKLCVCVVIGSPPHVKNEIIYNTFFFTSRYVTLRTVAIRYSMAGVHQKLVLSIRLANLTA